MKIYNFLTIIFMFFIKNVFCLTYKWLINGNKATIMFSSNGNNNIPTSYYGIIDISEVTNFNDIWFFDGYYYLNIRNCNIENNCNDLKTENKHLAIFYYNIKDDCDFTFDIYNIYETSGETNGQCGFIACKPEFEQNCNQAPIPKVPVNMRRAN